MEQFILSTDIFLIVVVSITIIIPPMRHAVKYLGLCQRKELVHECAHCHVHFVLIGLEEL